MSEQQPRTRASRRTRAALLVAGTCAGLLVAEGVARTAFFEEVDHDRLLERNRRTNFGEFTQPSAVPGLGYELRPGTQLRWNRSLVLAISQDGPYRIPVEGEEPVDPAATRIAVIGDSTSFGWRVPFHAAYPERFRSALAERVGGPFALRNFSVPGYNSEQERLVFERWVVPWRPALLILHYDHNDCEPSIHEKPVSYLDPALGDNPLRSALWKLLVRRTVQLLENRRRAELLALDRELVDGYAQSGALHDRHLAALGEIGRHAAKEGIALVAVVFDARLEPDGARLESDHYRRLHRPLLAALAAGGFEVLDLYPRLQAEMVSRGWRDSSLLWVAPDDAHPGLAGHHWIADQLFEFALERPALRARLVGDD